MKRKVAQRAQYNPLRPPNYVPPNQTSLAPFFIIGGIAAAVVIGVLLLLIL